MNTTRPATPRAGRCPGAEVFGVSAELIPFRAARDHSSTPGSRASASMAVSMPLRSTSLPSVSSRAGESRGATAPDGQKVPVSTPQGTTDTLPAGYRTGQFPHLVAAGGDDLIAGQADPAFRVDPLGGLVSLAP